MSMPKLLVEFSSLRQFGRICFCVYDRQTENKVQGKYMRKRWTENEKKRLLIEASNAKKSNE